MKKIASLFALAIISLSALPAAASTAHKPAAPLPPEKPAAEQEAAQPDVNQENLKQLVETLESDTARAEFLTNLKTLLDQLKAEEKKEDAIAPLTEQIGVRSFITQSADDYETFLEKHNLSGSVVNQALGSVIVLMVALVLLICERKLIKKLNLGTNRLAAHFEIGTGRLNMYVRMLNSLGHVVIAAVSVYTLSKIWGVEAIDRFFESAAARSALSNVITVLLVILLAALVWEAINIYLAYILRQATSNNHTRAKTLLPIIRNIVVAIFVGLFGLVLLSELGINVTPLLAGAGVIGVAIGFGAQSMVKDFLTGFTIILEDIVRVGDVVNMAGASGTVEKITLRKIQLRDFAGTVFTIPYSEIKTIQNLTKDFSFYVMDISVGYNSSIDQVVDVLRQVDEGLRSDDAFSFMILEPLEIAGVDKFADSAIVIKARIKTQPIRQWAVGREFNKRMKLAFDAAGIEIPFPQRTINLRGDAQGLGSNEVRKAILEEAAD